MDKNMPRQKQGKLILNGVILEKHEFNTVSFFLNLGKNIELIRPSLTPHVKNADFMMDSVVWEMKRPNQGTKRSLERMFYEATRQSPNIVIDLRSIGKRNANAIAILERCFVATRKARRLHIITPAQKLVSYRK